MKTKLKITGMSCQNCVSHIQKALSEVEGVIGAEVDLQRGTFEVSGMAKEQDLIEAVEGVGYQARVLK